MLGLPKQIAMQSLLYKTTTYLTQQRPLLLSNKCKKNLSKTTTTKLYQAEKWEKNIKQQCINNKRLSDYIYSNAAI